MNAADQDKQRQQDRLWQLTLHEDGVFSSRQNLFLVAESMLVVAYATLLGTDADSASTIAVVALLLTAAWLYASARHSHIVDHVQKQARQLFTDYEEIYAARKWWWLPLRSRAVTGYVVPLLVGALWVALLLTQPQSLSSTRRMNHGHSDTNRRYPRSGGADTEPADPGRLAEGHALRLPRR